MIDPHNPAHKPDQVLGERLSALTIGMDRLERRLNGGEGALD